MTTINVVVWKVDISPPSFGLNPLDIRQDISKTFWHRYLSRTKNTRYITVETIITLTKLCIEEVHKHSLLLSALRNFKTPVKFVM